MSGEIETGIVEQAGRGNPAAVSVLYERYWRAARAAAYGVTGDWALSEDAASAGFEQAVQSIPSLRDPGRFPAWLRTIVIRKARRAVRLRREITVGIDAVVPERRAAQPEWAEKSELVQLVRQAVRLLPEKLRIAVSLHHFEGYEAGGAARFLGIPPGTFRRRLHDARARIRQTILSGGDPMTGTGLSSGMPAFLAALLRGPNPDPAVLATVIEALGPASPDLIASAERIRRALPDGCVVRQGHAIWVPREDEERVPLAEAVRGLRDAESFQTMLEKALISDTLEVRWSSSGLELHDVQQFLEHLSSDVLPGVPARFAPYGEPRYRAALELRLQGAAERAATGGVLQDGEAALVRIYLEPWTSLRTGSDYSFTSVRTRWASESPM